jgi:hypothetical protein
MSKNMNRRAMLAGAAAVPAIAIAPSVALAGEPDPVFAAIGNYQRADAAFIARAMLEDELAEAGIRLANASGEHQTAEMVVVVNASKAARAALARTVPTTPAGLIAVTQFVREQSCDIYLFDDEIGDNECRAFVASIETAVRVMAGDRAS